MLLLNLRSLLVQVKEPAVAEEQQEVVPEADEEEQEAGEEQLEAAAAAEAAASRGEHLEEVVAVPEDVVRCSASPFCLLTALGGNGNFQNGLFAWIFMRISKFYVARLNIDV